AHALGVLHKLAEQVLLLRRAQVRGTGTQQVVADMVGRRHLAAGGHALEAAAVAVGGGGVRHAVRAPAPGGGELCLHRWGPSPAATRGGGGRRATPACRCQQAYQRQHGGGEARVAQPGPPPAPVPAAAGVVVVHVLLLFWCGRSRLCTRCTAWVVSETFPRRGGLLPP